MTCAVIAQSSDDGADVGTAKSSTGSAASTPQTPQSYPGIPVTPWPEHIPLPAATPASDSSSQVTPASITLPTPALPPPDPFASPTPAPTPSATPDQSAVTQPTPEPEFNPPSAERLNLPSAQPAGNPYSAPASVGMPSMKLGDSSAGSGALGGLFDWARKLRFQTGLRVGFDDNVNSASGIMMQQTTYQGLVTNTQSTNVRVADNQVLSGFRVKTIQTNVVTIGTIHTNTPVGGPIIASSFVNLNGGVNYNFGLPRFTINLDLSGGVTRYLNSNIAKPTQGTLGLGANIFYRFNPRLVLTFDSSSSYQQQPNITLVGTGNTGNNAYYYTSSSFGAAYQWSDLVSTITRLNASASYYPNTSSQGFNDPGFTESFRYLVKPTTTAVIDYNADYYGYGNNGNSSIGQSLDTGFDHVFNPKWFWNLRLGAETRNSKNVTSGNSTYLGPYMDSNFSWVLSKNSSINWVAHIGTQPSSQQTASYSLAFRSGLNYSQGIFTRLTFNAGMFYVVTNYKDVAVNGVSGRESYNQANAQTNLGLVYQLNRIMNFSLGYQYTTQNAPSYLASQAYNRGTTYLQVGAAF